MRRRVKLTESHLNRIVEKTIKQVLNEGSWESCQYAAAMSDKNKNNNGYYTSCEGYSFYVPGYDLDEFGIAVVEYKNRYNVFSKDKGLLCGHWFDQIYGGTSVLAKYGKAMVELNGKYNVIDKDGNLLHKEWF